jgi:RNA polymerase sigma factor (sigma-70 family)
LWKVLDDWKALKDWFIEPIGLETAALRFATTRTDEDRNILVQMVGPSVLNRVPFWLDNYEDACGEALLHLIEQIKRWSGEGDICSYALAKVWDRACDYALDDNAIGPTARHVRRKDDPEVKLYEREDDDPEDEETAVERYAPPTQPDKSYEVWETLRKRLTPKQLELVDDLVAGKTVREIAEEEGCAPSLIQKRIKNLRNKVHICVFCPSDHLEDPTLTGDAEVLKFAADGNLITLDAALVAFLERGVHTTLPGIRRWIRVGCNKGAIRLRSIRVGRRVYTKEVYINAFVDALNAA